jgi:hypothetical protein
MIKKCWQLSIFATQKLIFNLGFLKILGFLVFRAIPEYFISLLHEIINFRSLNSAALLLNLSVEIYGESVFIGFVVVEVNQMRLQGNDSQSQDIGSFNPLWIIQTRKFTRIMCNRHKLNQKVFIYSNSRVNRVAQRVNFVLKMFFFMLKNILNVGNNLLIVLPATDQNNTSFII